MKLFKNLLALVVVYSVFILTAIAFILLHISCVLRKHCFAYIPLLHHHACITSVTLLQLHHRKSLIKLTLLQLHHHMFLIKLTSITSLHLNYKMCSKLTLHHSCIPPYSPGIIHLQIQVFNFRIYHPPLFHSFINLSPLPSQTTSGILRNYCFLPLISRLIQDHNQLIKTQVFAPYALIKLIKFSIRYDTLHASMPTVMHDVIKPAVVYLPTKLATHKIVVALSPGNAFNMALVLPKFSPHLLQFMNFQVVLLLQVNLAPFVRILFVFFMTT